MAEHTHTVPLSVSQYLSVLTLDLSAAILHGQVPGGDGLPIKAAPTHNLPHSVFQYLSVLTLDLPAAILHGQVPGGDGVPSGAHACRPLQPACCL